MPGPTVTVTAAGPTVTVAASPALPPPGTPQLTGGTWKDAQSRTATLEARSAYSDVTLPAPSAYAGWKVRAQEAQAANGVPAKITLYLGETSCPARSGDRLHPEPSPTPPPAQAPTPAPEPKPKPDTNRSNDAAGTTGGSPHSSGGSSSTGGGNSTYYKNCTATRAAGAAPVHRGDPGCGRHLDRDGDGDGVGCE
ncbi:excalibur calcium-binding domain-containing protein [Streptomyces sp. NPDC096033]|uniref:excalibur calcium-binding domain-containing protein n=1 Tax=Streptomyces sp. NPDC096033 TaxID=3366071 RepID=UPI0037F6898B